MLLEGKEDLGRRSKVERLALGVLSFSISEKQTVLNKFSTFLNTNVARFSQK